MTHRITVVGYPGDVGGACTELWHTVRLWRRMGVEVTLVPTWAPCPRYKERLDALGCETVRMQKGELKNLTGTVVSMCNSNFIRELHTLDTEKCKVMWVNCMTFLFGHEIDAFHRRPPDVLMCHTEFQRAELEKRFAEKRLAAPRVVMFRGAFDPEEFPHVPRPHQPDTDFVIGRMARGDADKWSSNTWRIYERVQYRRRRGRLLGVSDQVRHKIGATPPWGETIKVNGQRVQDFLAGLHCLLPVNGGARENWPRAGLEAMAAGVPVVAQKQWGWREMIRHGETGFLGSCDEELAHHAATLAHDETLRLHVIARAYEVLVDDLCSYEATKRGWEEAFDICAT